MGTGIQGSVLALAVCTVGAAGAQVTVFDGATQLVTIPSVSLGGGGSVVAIG